VGDQKPREIAARVLGERGGQEYTETLLDGALSKAGLSSVDRGLCQELVYGVVRWQAALDWLITRKTNGRTQKTGLQNLLRLGLYQIFWLERIPDHAAVNETVEMAKRGGFGAQAGFVNAVLRGYLRESEETRRQLVELRTSQPATGWSHPDWLALRWERRWGREKTNKLLEWNNTPPKTYARVNTLKTDAEKLLPQWREEDVEYDFVRRDWLDENLVFELKSHPPLAGLPSFKQGFFYVQDPSTLLAVKELGPKPGDDVFDVCAAPGGKTTFIAQLMNNQGHVAATDVSDARVKLVRDNCERLGVTCVEAGRDKVMAQAVPDSDRVLVDAPCSNTGVLRRRVDLRWRIQPDELQRLRSLQLDLLRRGAESTKPGGTLIYSTCSLEPEENRQVIEEFVAGNAVFRLESERELLPFKDEADGAFVARFTRVR
jgi:16S rRNA (cytosine967-C5)-methyltransferase